MWPILLNLTRDECRLTLRRLELEAYSNMVNVFRAQGALEDNRKKLLEELRAVLHITHDRHSAEARRVSNDELLATIAEQLSGPNTGLGWISEGRRQVPLLPRGIPQTAYTEIADKAAEINAAENEKIQKRLEEKLTAPKPNERELPSAQGQTAESTLSSSDTLDDEVCPPIAMEDQTLKLWDTELITRKRKVPEGGAGLDDVTTPVKCMRNLPVNTHQRHLDLTQIYSKFSQPVICKPASQSKHSYNQVGKVSTSKSNQPRAPRSTPHKPRAPKVPKLPKAPKTPKQTKPRAKKQRDVPPLSPSKQYNPVSMQLEYAGPPNTFQASYAQAVLGNKSKSEFDDIKSKVISSSSMMADSPTMQLLTQPATLPHKLEVPEAHTDDVTTSIQPQSAQLPKVVASKHHIIKARVTPDQNPKSSDVKVLQKPMEGIKVLANRQVMVATPAQKVLSAPPQKLCTPAKFVTTKVIGSVQKTRIPSAPVKTEQMIVVSKAAPNSRNLASSRLIVTSAASTVMKERTLESVSNVARLTETLTPKGIPATDLKVSAKALVLNPKGQKMVVVPSKARTKLPTEHERKLPLIHFRGIPTSMKLVPVSQTVPARSTTVTVLSKPAVSSLPSTPKIVGMETIKTANLADIVPVKGLTPVTAPKVSNPIVRPLSTKGNVIVVQKGTPIGKALTFAKNGNDMSKIIMGKNVTQLLQASKTETEAGKPTGNVIVLELNNEQSGRPTTMSEILDSRTAGGVARLADQAPHITPDTPVLFDTQLAEDACNTTSLESTVESIAGIAPIEDISIMEKDDPKSQFGKETECAKDSSSVTDWEMELDTVSRKDKDDDKLNSLHLDLGMSSDSDGEYMGSGRKRKSERSTPPRHTPTSGESGGVFSSSSAMSLATRTLLSQLQDEGSSSNDSSFALKTKAPERAKTEPKLDKVESDELTKAKEKLSEKVAEASSRKRRIDVYSTAIAPSDINLDSFAYLDDNMMAGDDVFAGDEVKAREARREHALDDQLRRLLGEDCSSAPDSTVSDAHK